MISSVCVPLSVIIGGILLALQNVCTGWHISRLEPSLQHLLCKLRHMCGPLQHDDVHAEFKRCADTKVFTDVERFINGLLDSFNGFNWCRLLFRLHFSNAFSEISFSNCLRLTICFCNSFSFNLFSRRKSRFGCTPANHYSYIVYVYLQIYI